MARSAPRELAYRSRPAVSKVLGLLLSVCLLGLFVASGFVAITSQEHWPLYGIGLMSTCPIFGIMAPDLWLTPWQDGPPQPETTYLVLAINLVLLIVFALLAREARLRAAAKAREQAARLEAQ